MTKRNKFGNNFKSFVMPTIIVTLVILLALAYVVNSFI